MSIVGQNIRKLREAVEDTQSAFAARFGLNRGQIASYEAEEKASEPSLATVMAIVDKFDIDIRAFISDPTFDGHSTAKTIRLVPEIPPPANLSANTSANLSPNSKTKRTNFSEDAPAGKLRILVTTVDASGSDNISLVNTRVAAGYAAGGFTEREFVQTLPAFSLPDKAFKNGTFRAFQVSGDSMLPTLFAGDWVICRFIEQWDRDIRDTFVHVIVTEERPLVKRLLNRLNDRGQVCALSDNPAYPTQFIERDEVREVWVAVGRLSRQFANPAYDIVKEVSRTRSDVDELMAQFQAMQAQLGLPPI